MVIGTRRFGAYYGRCTYVKPTYRGKGIATALWTKLLGQWPSRKVYLVAFSDLGKTMVESLKQQYPDTKWYITEEGDRPLRRLSRGE
jgi:GNAT superfamily N-acetyltransferase